MGQEVPRLLAITRSQGKMRKNSSWSLLKKHNAAAAAASLQSCPTLQPHRWQPTRLLCSWDSSGKNTGVGCHFLLQCMEVKSESEVTQSCQTLHDPMDCNLPGPSVDGIFQARGLEWGAMSSNTTLLTPKFQTFTFLNCERINFACSMPPLKQLVVLGCFVLFCFCSVRKLVEPVTIGVFYSFAHIFYKVTSLGIVIVLITPLLTTASSHWITKCESRIRGIWGLSSGNRLYTIVT